MYECRLGTVGGYSQCVRCDSSRASSVPRRDWRVPIIDHYGSEGVARFILHYAYVSQARADKHTMAEGHIQHKAVYKTMTEFSNTDQEDASPPPVTYEGFGDPLNRPKPRLVDRSDGRSAIKYRRQPQLTGRGLWSFLSDFFTTMIDSPWYIVLLVFSVLYISSWFAFAFAWWATVAAYDRAYDSNTVNFTCVQNTYDFPSSLLFSVETQVTIGYGFKFIRSECGFAILLVMVQSLVGLLIDSFMLGLVFAKLSRPGSRRKTIFFSNRAVINERDGKRVLEFRIADIRRSQLVEGHVRMQLYWNKKREDGTSTMKQYDLNVGYDTGHDRLFLLCPVTVAHVIDESSPLASLTEENHLAQDLEIVVILEAIVEATGLTAQALWSYTQQEIHFNYEFVPMVYRQTTGKEKWEVDFALLSHTRPITQRQGEDL